MEENNKFDFYLNIDKYYIENIDKIILIGAIKITPDLFNNIDNIILKYYGTIEYLPLLMLFNNISDLTSIKIGTLIKLPDINSLIDNVYIVDDTINISLQTNKINIKSNKTTASPKLNISMKKVNYDDSTGIISF